MLTLLGIGEETLREPLRLKPFEHWVGHIPFAFWIVAALRPRVLVEIGTHRGNSFLAFCQAIEAERCGTRAYAVDTWEGDIHMAREDGLFEELSAYHDPLYGHFSSLIRSTFDDARALFSDGSIDLLHIDGTHDYDSVRRDFATWETALSERSVVLFHDSNVRRANYGVWKLWEELKSTRPHFEFFHSYGLGVLGVGGELPAPLTALFDAGFDAAAAQSVRAFFAARGLAAINRLGRDVEHDRAEQALRLGRTELEALAAQHEAALGHLRDEHATELAALRDQHAAERDAAGSRHDSDLEALRLQHVAQSGSLRAQHEQELEATTRDALGRFEAVLKQHNDRFLRRSMEANVTRLRIESDLRDALEARRHGEERHAQEVAEAQARAAHHAEEVRILRASTSWRMTGPLRGVVELLSAGKRSRPGAAPATPAPGAPPPPDEAPAQAAAPQDAPKPAPAALLRMPDLFALRDFQPSARIAVVAHIFYPEIAEEVLNATRYIPEAHDLFVTLVEGHSEHLADWVRAHFPVAHIWCFPNRGRDILPFMALAETGALAGYALICKLHTKRSPHMTNGDVWRQHLVSGVLPDRDGTAALIAAFDADPDLGLVVADGQIFGGDVFWSGNTRHLEDVLPRMGRTLAEATQLAFAGGSIFWLRSLVLRDLVGLGLSPHAYEPEPTSSDGALAHAVERLFSVACHSAGLRIEQASLAAAAGRAVPIAAAEALELPPPRVVAFYLPQYHPIPENDRWWGRGFTEWTNVTAAKPLFPGHRQPRLPGELGFTDLRLPETRLSQAELARRYGVSAFCYYYYWFGAGRRLLQRPLDEILASGQPDFPFLICWANEPWSRNWDGANREVLVPQDYPEGWVAAFARDVAPILRDRRYVRLSGPGSPPMLMIYRIMHLPRPAEAMAALRAELRELGVGEVHLSVGWFAIGGDAATPENPAELNCDSFFEFPPHRLATVPAPADAMLPGMTGQIYEYAPTVDRALAALDERQESGGTAAQRRHRAVMMGWDNTARRGPAAYVFRGATPGHFRRWLRGVVRHEQRQPGDEERLVFVNAWNEWAEGTSLEPDRDFGRGWLEAVQSALAQPSTAAHGPAAAPDADDAAGASPDAG